ncbi:protein-tyrosine phosphatase family protein [Saccharothrix coeruleofusca]|uniref:Protein-tyrosine-phosphatase n=1 Tax=Saccharothrix coeruleofusca TaxID=33919 RepID=A0A918EDS8_9PSEU|nr:protein-tyrosine phosphatase family protein [Saccharothrix coeruleofusca]MBP2338678.1 hypothetical protein [Saccharothrix coeruleofusca]GGP46712.1 protein-tyrosine-phosphatase [Saccharothrix coeruleofusca]
MKTLPGAIELPDGTRVRGRGLKRSTADGVPDYGLYLGGKTLRRKFDDRLTWPHEWVHWPDFLLPTDRAAAVALIKDLHERAKSGQRVEVACGGGVGRTGTVVACLAILSGVPADEAVAWTREHLNHRAVETPWQRAWVRSFA